MLELLFLCLNFDLVMEFTFSCHAFMFQIFKCFLLFWQRTNCCLMVDLAFLCSGMPEASQPHCLPCNNNLA